MFFKKKNKEYAEANVRFLEENAKNEGVITLPSGVQYRVIEEGDGDKPNLRSIVQVYYSGKMIDGKQFDSNMNDNVPIAFRLNEVIEGWQIALSEMPAGSTWEIFIPQELGYGDSSVGNIKKYSTLIFTVKLVSVS